MMLAQTCKVEALETKWLHAQNALNDWPLLWHLALRQRSVAMTELARRLGSGGAISDPFSARGLARRAYRKGDATSAYNLAMDYFDERDLKGYRHWLAKAAAAGFPDAQEELCYFQTRLSHTAARNIGRGRPPRSYD